MNNFYQNKTSTNLLILTILAFTFTLGCKKISKPKMKNSQTLVEVETLSSIVPLGDDDDERILIKPKLFLSSGEVAVGAEVHVENEDFETSGFVDAANDLEIEVPEVGFYQCDVVYGGNVVLANGFFIDENGLSLSGVIPDNAAGSSFIYNGN
jgi:hypothetical protein